MPRIAPATLLLLGIASPAMAQSVKPLVDARLRYEHADQDGLPRTADGVTARVRAGLSVSDGRWSALAEAQGNLAIVGDYFDGLHPDATRPLIADPQSIGLYRAQVQYRAPAMTLTAGRQRIVIDDERFVGAAAIRNNGQTFDAVRAELTPAKGLKADVTYAWAVHTVWGIDGTGARQGVIEGNNILANLGYTTPIGTLTGFAYLVDQDEAAVQAYRLSSQTYGLRFAGSRAIGKAKLGYQASWARQSDHGRNPNDYSADYWLADASLDLAGPRLGLGYEVLGADDGRPFTSFQTPLAAVFKFNGWTEKFTPKPADGLRDLYASGGWGWKQVGRAKNVSVQAIWHRFESDRLVRHYGDELNFLAQATLGRTTASVRYADYRADRFATDTRKFWLQLDWTI
ncbi:hypothetical protein [Sphingomonas sp. Leaf25]|uniref:hypothetical protein n=1 Tax=Sphingomonas sp. Leaf25 TaxID=1735692 RepID=UPI0006F71FC4|nr:hypothetical protein [Sphingomonas sp. Leaf25]KQN00590.1 hypothetical protein ASE78_03625 [Sphingomonas sp. Leaf25]